jgi:hypothetical protein
MDEEILKYREFLNPPSGDRGYFDFEEDFIEENVRCIPMLVRFKMDAAGIKLKLSEWSKFKLEERVQLALQPVSTPGELESYNIYLVELVAKYTGNKATVLAIETKPGWADTENIPAILKEKAGGFGLVVTPEKWKSLGELQRFALLKLSKSEHENKNLPKAFAEFGLMNK